MKERSPRGLVDHGHGWSWMDEMTGKQGDFLQALGVLKDGAFRMPRESGSETCLQRGAARGTRGTTAVEGTYTRWR